MKKRLFPLILLLICSLTSEAQIEYNRFSIQAFGGMTTSYMDATNDNLSTVFGGAFHYNPSPFSFVALDIQVGTLQAGKDTDLRKFKNNYSSYSVTYNLGLGDFLRNNATTWRRITNDVYIGAGVTVIKNDVAEVKPFDYTTADGTFTEGENFSGTEYAFPVQAGVNFKYRTKKDKVPFAINLQYQFNFSFSDILDGYEGSPGNKKTDWYSVLWLGVKYYFGPTRIYYKNPK